MHAGLSMARLLLEEGVTHDTNSEYHCEVAYSGLDWWLPGSALASQLIHAEISDAALQRSRSGSFRHHQFQVTDMSAWACCRALNVKDAIPPSPAILHWFVP